MTLRIYPKCYKKFFTFFSQTIRMSGNVNFRDKKIEKSDFYKKQKSN